MLPPQGFFEVLEQALQSESFSGDFDRLREELAARVQELQLYQTLAIRVDVSKWRVCCWIVSLLSCCVISVPFLQASRKPSVDNNYQLILPCSSARQQVHYFFWPSCGSN